MEERGPPKGRGRNGGEVGNPSASNDRGKDSPDHVAVVRGVIHQASGVHGPVLFFFGKVTRAAWEMTRDLQWGEPDGATPWSRF